MSESNKPDWKDAPEWAQWVACDASGKFAGQWWWFDDMPKKVDYIEGVWVNNGEGAKFSGSVASPEWAYKNWESSIEKRPDESGAKPKNVYLESKAKRRVTLFIDFECSVYDDAALSRNIAEMLCNRLNGEHTYPGDKFTPGSSTNRIRIAIGTDKTDEVLFDEQDGFYVKENIQ